VQALRGVSFRAFSGEVTALVGDNGAGKSTLIKVLSGVHSPDEGQLLVDGRPVHVPSPQAASALGIETVYQDLALAPDLDAAANVFLGRELRRFRVLHDQPEMRRRTAASFAELGVGLVQDLRVPVASFSGGQRQSVAIARAAMWAEHVIIMDEPTAALGVKESRRVLELILEVKRRGLPIVLISHNMPHVFEVADRIHVHRLGKRLCVINPKDYTMSDAVAFMTGAKVPEEATEAA